MDRWLSHPTVMKLMALALGILLWAVVHFDPENPPSNVASLVEVKTIRSVQVHVVGLDEQRFELVDMQPKTIDLTVRGTRADILATRPEDYRLSVDLSELEAGTHTVSVQIDAMPRGLQLVSMNPGAVSVTLEPLQTKEFEVQLMIRGEPAEGYVVGKPILRPSNRAYVTLPDEELARVARVGAVIDVDGERETIRDEIRLVAYDADGKIVEGAIIYPAVLEVEVPITLPFKTVPLQFRFQGEPAPGLAVASFQPDVDQVTVYGPQAELDRLEVLPVHVPMRNIRQTGRLELPLKAPSANLTVEPAQVTVQVEVVKAATRTFKELPVYWNGLGDGLRATVREPKTGRADIVVSGAPDVLDRLKPGDVMVIADLSGRGPGVYTVSLIVNLPRFVTQVGGTRSVTVEITPEGGAASPQAGGDSDEAVPAGEDVSDGQDGGGSEESDAAGSGDGAEGGAGSGAGAAGDSVGKGGSGRRV